MQIPYLARHCRVLTFDGRGNGRSDRPDTGYDEREFAADALAVMDATGTERATLVSLSMGAQWALTAGGRSPRARRVGASSSARPSPLGESPQDRMLLLERRARHRRGLGEVQPPLLAEGLPRLPRVLLLADVHRAALDQADRGLRRLGARDDARDAHRHAGSGGLTPRRHARAGGARAVPGARHPGLRGRDHRPRPRASRSPRRTGARPRRCSRAPATAPTCATR